MKEIIQRKFSGGISDDIRQQQISKSVVTTTQFSISQHFDIFSSPNKLTPYRDWIADDTGQVGILNFLWDGTFMWGLGINLSGGLHAQLYRKSGLLGTWAPAPNGTSSDTYINVPGTTFVMYKGFIYYFGLVNSLNRYEIQTSVHTSGFQSLSTQNIAQGLVHSKSDNLYIPYNNILAQMDGTVWTSARLTLPSNCVITALAEYGNYLAIFTRPSASGVTTSKVYLWDMESDDVTDILDFGAGDLYIGGTVNGQLVGVMNEASSGINTIPFSGVTFSKQKVFIKTYAGGPVELFKTLVDAGLLCGQTLGLVSTGRCFIQSNSGLSFSLFSNGTKVPTGLYTLSTAGEGEPLAVTCDRTVFNATPIASTLSTIVLPGIQGFIRVGNVWFVSYNATWIGGAGDLQNATAHVGRTDDNPHYTFPAFLETQLFDIGDPSGNYEIAGLSEFSAELPVGASVTFKYRISLNDDWTTIFMWNTPGDIAHDAICLEIGDNIGDNFEQFSNVQFRLESLGGAEITGYMALINVLRTLLG